MGIAFSSGWQAGLEVTLEGKQGLTRMAHLRHWGPLRVQRPFYPDNDNHECHLYLLHPPGGMVTGDVIQMDIAVENGAHGLLTTPSAGKIYRGNHSDVSQKQDVVCRVKGKSYLEWMPQETIVFDGARGNLSLRVELESGSNCCLWDIVCLGRPASGEAFADGYLRQKLELLVDGTLMYSESNRFEGGSDFLSARWGLAGMPVSGTLLVSVDVSEDQLTMLRERTGMLCVDGEKTVLSNVDGLLAARYLGKSAEHCKKIFTACWRELRPLMTGKDIIEPRIWRT